MITDNIILCILQRKISGFTAFTGYKGKIEKSMFSKADIHLIQPIDIKEQIATHQNFCLKLIFSIEHLRKHGYTAYIAYKKK